MAEFFTFTELGRRRAHAARQTVVSNPDIFQDIWPDYDLLFNRSRASPCLWCGASVNSTDRVFVPEYDGIPLTFAHAERDINALSFFDKRPRHIFVAHSGCVEKAHRAREQGKEFF